MCEGSIGAGVKVIDKTFAERRLIMAYLQDYSLLVSVPQRSPSSEFTLCMITTTS
jgi:hypothetical protein